MIWRFGSIVLCVAFCLHTDVAFTQQSSAIAAMERYSISGVVKDKNGITLPGAVVFLSNSQKITSSYKDGAFKLDGLPAGTYQIIAKMIGYTPANKNIVVNSSDIRVELILDEGNNLLNEVVIKSANDNKKYLSTFLRYFIGESANSSKCKLLNPELLHFHYNSKTYTLSADAADFLIIENRGLGYRIKYLLTKFEYNEADKLLNYSGSPYFEDLPGTVTEQKQWANRRNDAYLGSVMHFFRSVANNNLAADGFVTYDSSDKQGDEIKGKAAIIDSLWEIKALNNDLKYIRPKKTIFVDYTKGYDETMGRNKPGQASEIIRRLDSAYIDKNGSFTSITFLFAGYWSKKAVAEMLPLDYQYGHNHSTMQAAAIPQNPIVNAIDNFAATSPTEKVFLQTDKPYYSIGDTIWMKGYVLDAALNYSKQSGLLYTELINDTGKVVMRQVLPVKYGISIGQMELPLKYVPEGGYTLRAYTNWMQNQGDESFFKRQIYVSANTAAWLVNRQTNLTSKDGKDNLEIALKVTEINQQPVMLSELQLKVMNGNKVISRDNVQTDISGKVNFNLNLSDKVDSRGITILAQDVRKGGTNKKLIIPLIVNREKNIDLQFMPEGGQLVAGLQCRVGFKVIAEDGTGMDVKGTIVDSKNNEVSTFESRHSGMGNFNFTPAANEIYSAKIISPIGTVKSYPLPPIKSTGIVLSITNIAGRDSLLIAIQGTPGLNDYYTLIGQCDGAVCYLSDVHFFANHTIINGKVAKNRFPTGITKFTLFDGEKQPVAERMIFIDHEDGLKINIVDKPEIHPKDSTSITIKVTDRDNNPIIGSFSLAVTDDGQIKTDSTNVPNIKTYMLLVADLKGNIEQPGYYFDNKNADRNEALDNLLLTQGWVGYDWKTIFDPKYQPKFKSEPEIQISGYLTRVGGKDLKGLPISLMSIKKPRVIRDTVSDQNGHFLFRDLPRTDTASFVLQVKDKKGKMYEANITVDEFKPAAVAAQSIKPLTPWYVNSNSTLLNYNKQSIAYQQALDKIKYPEGGHHLREVTINDKKIIKGSHNLNGPGEADQIFDEQDMKALGKTTLEDMLNKGMIKGFGTGWFPKGYPNSLAMKGFSPISAFEKIGIYHQTYQIYANKMHLVIDGVDVHTFFQPAVPEKPDHYEEYNFYKTYLKKLTAEDIKGIEVLYNNQYNNKYKYAYLELAELDHTRQPSDSLYVEYAFLEITTWSGNGAYMHRTAGRYIYNPPPISWPKEFYKPKYSASGNNPLIDLRPTVAWEPNVITNKKGEATVKFYTKSKIAGYTLIVQGCDLNGKVGATLLRISH